MDIREVSKEEKRGYIDNVNLMFDDMKKMLKTVSEDMESDDLITQASAVWVGGNLCSWFTDFMTQLKKIDEAQATLNELQTEIKETVDANYQSSTH